MAQTIQELTTDIRNSVAGRGNGKTVQELVREIRDAVKNGIIKESDVRSIIAELTDGAPEEFDTFKEIQDYLETLYTKDDIDTALAGKADVLSTVQSDTVKTIVVLTQAQYNALTTKDANTEYNIIGE